MCRPSFVILLLLTGSLGAGLPAVAQVGPAAPVLSPRVGDVISQEERAYFGLFPDVPGFTSATVYRSGDSTLAFRISQSGGSGDLYHELPVSRPAFEELGRYIDRFEQVYRRTQEVSWGRLIPFAAPIDAVRPGVEVSVRTTDGRSYVGRLLFADEEVLVLSPSGDPERLLEGEEPVFLTPSEIALIEDRWPALRRIVSEILLPLNGEEEVYRRHGVDLLSEHATFEQAASPELRAMISAVLEERKQSVTPARARVAPPRIGGRRYHVTLTTTLIKRVDAGGYAVMMGATEAGRPEVRPPRAILLLTVDRSVARRIWLGALLRYAPPARRIEEAYGTPTGMSRESAQDVLESLGTVALSGAFTAAMFSYVLKPYRPTAYLVTRKPRVASAFEVRAAAGPSLAFLRVHTVLNSSARLVEAQERYLAFGNEASRGQRVFGGAALLDAAFHLNSGLSFGAGLQTLYYPRVEVEDLEADPADVYPGSQKKLVGGVRPLYLHEFFLHVRVHL